MSRLANLDKLEVTITVEETEDIIKAISSFNEALEHYRKAFTMSLPASTRTNFKKKCEQNINELEATLKKANKWAKRLERVAKQVSKKYEARKTKDPALDQTTKNALVYLKRLEERITFGDKEMPASGTLAEKDGALEWTFRLKKILKKSIKEISIPEANKAFTHLHARLSECKNAIDSLFQLESKELELDKPKKTK